MVRARLTLLLFAGSSLFITGCSSSGMFGGGGSGGGFSLFHRSSRNNCPVVAYPAGCDCCDVGCPVSCCPTPGCPTPGCTTGCGPGVPLISNAHPPIMEGPALFPPAPTTMPMPGPMMPQVMPQAMPQAMAPRPGPLPQIITVPQARMTPSPP